MLILPAWFDEANKLRHLTVATIRALEAAGITSVLPDLPGCNESPSPLEEQDLDSWRKAARLAAEQHGCTHVLTIRASAHIAPDLPGFAYAPIAPDTALRALTRARVIASQEGGRKENAANLIESGRQDGLELTGYNLGSNMIAQMSDSAAVLPEALRVIRQAEIGGAALWLRSEPDHDQAQAEALARLIAAEMAT
ncbi:hypothetical protein E5222_06515 [Alteraurantiacibacter aquimixticola]|uniref:Uncharacterized protein n=1 Tax=Alteraurantiacibacter aquimixticola TaxID=2489173 RepID=A0A4T3F2D7_9SPHN|nr:hypothetical protein E5222_06515 [Alteraurantiacibacter aquimixticola]